MAWGQKEPYVRIYGTNVDVWESAEHMDTMRARVLLPAVAFLSSRGWSIGPDEAIERNYKAIAPNHFAGTKGDLVAVVQLGGRHFSMQIWQDIYRRDRTDTGRYESNRRGLMPTMLGRRCDLEMLKVSRELARLADAPIVDERRPNETADERLARQYTECWHTDKTLGHAPFHCDGNRRSGDGGLLTQGCTVWTRNRQGRLLRGNAFYHLNSMWWVKLGPRRLWNLSAHELLTHPPADVRAKAFSVGALESRLRAAVKRGDFLTAHHIQRRMRLEAA